MTQAYGKLKGLLKELFQFDREDLDFGIYRIMNHKRDEILKFLDHDLLPQVKEAFGEYVKGDESQKRERMAEIEEAAARFNADPENDEEYQQLKAELGETRSVSVLENEVYSDLYTFFRRYYKNGDFLSLRRYKPGVYAVPYEGEEVKLHWANADQYYVKTAENFRNYRFELDGVGPVNLDLVAAATERDNNKAQSGKERRFVLREEDPVEETDGELHVFFEYRPHPDKQKDLVERARDAIFENAPGEWKNGLAEPLPTQSNKDRTLLEKHLAEYTARNTFDYFIHKDLGGFLRRELDFFLKSEVLHIDDLDTENEQRVEQYLSKLKVIKRIGYKLIVFLAQIEDFQKKLFLKKKFVVSSGYCLTLDNVPEDLYAEIAANDAQYEEWEKLFSISEIPPNLENGNGDQRSIEWLKANPYLVLDTKFFDPDFEDRLLASIEDLDEKTDGLLVNSENFQALNLLRARFRERVKCIYIDPPYNTGGDGFLYKDQYQHSSWLALMQDRLQLSHRFLENDGVFLTSIGGNEQTRIGLLADRVFGDAQHVGTVVWKARVKPVNIGSAKFRPQNETEYVLMHEKEADKGDFSPLYTGSVRSYPHEEDGRRYRLTTILKSNRGANFRNKMRFEVGGYMPPEDQRWQAGHTSPVNVQRIGGVRLGRTTLQDKKLKTLELAANHWSKRLSHPHMNLFGASSGRFFCQPRLRSYVAGLLARFQLVRMPCSAITRKGTLSFGKVHRSVDTMKTKSCQSIRLSIVSCQAIGRELLKVERMN